MNQHANDGLRIKVYTVSLGCPKNRCDTEMMLGRLGPWYVPADNTAEADVILINTCGFIQPAVEESLQPSWGCPRRYRTTPRALCSRSPGVSLPGTGRSSAKNSRRLTSGSPFRSNPNGTGSSRKPWEK